MWNKWATWYKCAIIGLIIAGIVSIGLFKELLILTNLSSIGSLTCQYLTDCNATGSCIGCSVIGIIFNLIYGFVLGGIIGYIIGKLKGKDKNKINKKSKKRK